MAGCRASECRPSFGERHHSPRVPRSHDHRQRTRLHRALAAYVAYYLKAGTHLSLNKDSPRPSPGRPRRRPAARSWQSPTLVAYTTTTNVARRSPRSIPFPAAELQSGCANRNAPDHRGAPDMSLLVSPLAIFVVMRVTSRLDQLTTASRESSDEVFRSHSLPQIKPPGAAAMRRGVQHSRLRVDRQAVHRNRRQATGGRHPLRRAGSQCVDAEIG